MPVDLHLHTHHSDGTWTPTQVVNRAIELRLKHIAITDHDTTAGIEEARLAAGEQLEVINGIEINTVWTDGVEKEDVHILGYFIDPDNADLHQLLDKQQSARMQLITDTITKLGEYGINLSLEKIRSFAGIGSIGRPHITQAIVAAGGAADVNEAFAKYMNRSSPFYVARNSVAPIEAVKAIVSAGGLASVAHPGKSKNIEKIILQLKTVGLSAVEAYHRRHNLDRVKHYLKFARQNQLVVTGGSDCHGPFEQYPASIGSVSVPLEVVRNLRALTAVKP